MKEQQDKGRRKWYPFPKIRCKIRILLPVVLLLNVFHISAEEYLPSVHSFQQGIRVTGAVTDDEGEMLTGVNVVIRGTTQGTTTDINGEYMITIPSDTSVLQFSFMGYRMQEIMVGNRRIIAVTLQAETTDIGEVTVVAFGTQKKESVIASITSVNPSELKVPSSNLTTAFAGRLSGVISYQRSGEPGADNADFFIRGVTTFGYKKDPLILIDGIESTSDDLSRVQTDDLESFSIMKDATATAMFGSRAANGVILIKTKEGREGPAKINLRFENSMSMPTRNVELADPITYMRLHNEAVLTRDPLGLLPYSLQKIDNTIAGMNEYMYPVTDWRKELIKDYTMNQRVNLNVSGGGKVASYYIAGSFNQNNGLLKVDKRNNFNSNIDLKTYALRLNVNVNVTKTTKINAKISGTFDDYSGPMQSGTQVYRDVMRSNPVLFPAYYPADEEHRWVQHIMFGNYDDGSGLWYMNPYAEMVRGYREYSKSVMNAQFEIRQELSFLLKGLSVRTMANTSRNAYFEVQRGYTPFWYQATSYNPQDDTYKLICLNEEGTGSGTEYLSYEPGSKTVSSNFYSETALDYANTFSDKHAVGGIVLFMVQTKLDGNTAVLQQSLPYRNVGIAGRATYSYDERYYTELSFGYNASERFHKSHRWGFFPSIGMAWTISNERFWEDLKKNVNNFKLKVTYGLTGNDAIGDANSRFLFLSEVNMSSSARSATFGREGGYSRNGIAINRYADPNITWETAKKINIGMEIGLFNKLEIQADIYQDKRSNILQDRASTPAEMGLSAQPKANIGKAEGRGIDLSVDYNHAINSDFWVQARANFTYAANEFIVYEEYDYQDAWWKSHKGYSISQQWGYLAERLFVDDQEARKSPTQTFSDYGGGDIKYHDVNRDGQITTLDQVPIGYPTTPEIVYGFGFSLGYKYFDFSAFFQGLARESFWINPQATAPFVSFFYDNESFTGIPQNQLLKAYADSHWSEDNQDLYAMWPRLSTTATGNTNNFQRSTWFMRNGAFLRLKQVEIGYTLPESIAEKLYMKSFRIYLSSTNPLCWSKFDLWDVEMGGNGLGYPIQKVFNIGVLLSF
ncbi:MAG: TonB-dependent receptor [Bacteroidales bacterium]|jgi:TonB-linked SusC/RagA family outer membrane protein|nr:TonB-dependent receptor [Bacteroidales bacterium]